MAIRHATGLDFESIEFGYECNGKPFILDYTGLYFNISHSGDWVICGAGDSPLGVDVEAVSPNNMDFFEGYFSKEEIELSSAFHGKDSMFNCHQLWTVKECYAKAKGLGLGMNFREIRVHAQTRGGIHVCMGDEPDDSMDVTICHLDGGHAAAVAQQKCAGFPFIVEMLPVDGADLIASAGTGGNP